MRKESKASDALAGGRPSVRPAGRIESVEEYYFSKKLAEVAAMNADGGEEVINLGIGSPDMPPSEEAVDTFCREIRKADAHGYQPYTGIAALREAFAEWYGRWYGVALDAQREIQPLIGSKEGILHVSLAFLNAGDGVLTPNPGYPAYRSVAKLVGADAVSYTLDEANGWHPDFDALEELLAARRRAGLPPVKLMWANYPNMPTGAAATAGLFEQLTDFGSRHGIVVCHDNPYSFILNEHPQSILSVPGAKEICIELNSMSKSHNMPGWRMGMLASNPQFVGWILKVKSNVDSGQFRPMQSAVARALGAGREWYDAMNAVYRSRRVLAGRIMEALGCVYDGRQAGMFLWGRISGGEESGEALVDGVLREARVFITPGFIFGSAGKRYVRISLCCKNEKLEQALSRIRQWRGKGRI
jgi:aspartate/methionine/tyrosine aminotransferase